MFLDLEGGVEKRFPPYSLTQHCPPRSPYNNRKVLREKGAPTPPPGSPVFSWAPEGSEQKSLLSECWPQRPPRAVRCCPLVDPEGTDRWRREHMRDGMHPCDQSPSWAIAILTCSQSFTVSCIVPWSSFIWSGEQNPHPPGPSSGRAGHSSTYKFLLVPPIYLFLEKDLSDGQLRYYLPLIPVPTDSSDCHYGSCLSSCLLPPPHHPRSVSALEFSF